MKLITNCFSLEVYRISICCRIRIVCTKNCDSCNLDSNAEAASRTRMPVSRYPITTDAPSYPCFCPTKSSLNVSAIATYEDLSPAFAFCFLSPDAPCFTDFVVSTRQRSLNFIKRGCCSYISHNLISSQTTCLSSVSAAVDLADPGWPEQALPLLLVVKSGSSLNVQSP